MKRLELTPDDLLRLRFAHSPMAEVVTSALALRGDAWQYSRWRRRLGTSTDGLDVLWRVLDARSGGIPDFLTPVPRTARPTLESELAVIAATHPDRIAAELDCAGIGYDDPAALIPPLLAQIRRYFDLALADLWPRLRATADNEIAHRTTTAAFPGPHSLLADLHPRLRWDPDALHLDYLKDTPQRPWSLHGEPLYLLPTAFTGAKAWIMDSPAGRALWYPPRAVTALFAAPAPPPEPLAALLGATRAAVLTLLSTPSSTGDVAERLGLAPATASHHLTALRDAGLIVAARSGRRLNYRHTDLGERLSTGG
ncbi:winged helix-turn-helix transcriptional regulator [Dactylosporangium vinaceum]|uniref:ArsR/SmtB family transcription factor n=1 Tax=Dactylosporangium vinaceum TaxID=53362 RepID=A0ABV5MJB2_9ACTN|nr:helix-turn-helix domain-containing protein [Dactylosporangium vinaceum]UAB93622.1 winged helix-turn-helix transcriptional regulator [Dactylosporangium vinaceum]